MLDEKDLQAIAQLMDSKISASEKRITQSTLVMMESYFEPKFNLLADSIANINEKLKALPDPELMEQMQEELDMHHDLLKLHTKELAKLKKAN